LLREVYDVARRDTFENLDLWLQEVEVYSPAGGRDVVKLLVGNKIDKVRLAFAKTAGTTHGDGLTLTLAVVVFYGRNEW
jgi:hypothetical protein